MPSIFKLFSTIIFISFIGSISLILWFYFLLSYPNHNNEPTFFTIKKGQNFIEISQKMKKEDLTFHAQSTKYLLAALSKYKKIHYGEYQVAPHSKFIKLINAIFQGKVYYRKLYIPSGFTNQRIFAIIDKTEKLTGDFDRNNIQEGMIFPDTYYYESGNSKASLIAHMQKQTLKILEKEWKHRDLNLPYKSPYEALIVASMIEKEAKTLEDKKKVASVILNRLRVGQKLELDATVQYIFEIKNGQRIPLQRSHFAEKSPHNTYYITGLPISAICNAGLNSLKAAFHPDQTNYFYYISMPNKSDLIFTDNYRTHLINVSKLRDARRQLKTTIQPNNNENN